MLCGCRHNEALLPSDKRTRERIRDAALGNAPRAAKFAARLVARGVLGDGGPVEVVEVHPSPSFLYHHQLTIDYRLSQTLYKTPWMRRG